MCVLGGGSFLCSLKSYASKPVLSAPILRALLAQWPSSPTKTRVCQGSNGFIVLEAGSGHQAPSLSSCSAWASVWSAVVANTPVASALRPRGLDVGTSLEEAWPAMGAGGFEGALYLWSLGSPRGGPRGQVKTATV